MTYSARTPQNASAMAYTLMLVLGNIPHAAQRQCSWGSVLCRVPSETAISCVIENIVGFVWLVGCGVVVFFRAPSAACLHTSAINAKGLMLTREAAPTVQTHKPQDCSTSGLHDGVCSPIDPVTAEVDDPLDQQHQRLKSKT